MVTSPCSSPVFRSTNPNLTATTPTHQFSPPPPPKIRLQRPNLTVISSFSAAAATTSAASPTSERTKSPYFSSPQFDLPSLQSPGSSSLYEVLGISIDASTNDIKSAYRKLARVCHPDVNNNDELTTADDFMRIHDAYCTLSDPHKRADYDRKLSIHFRRSKPLSSSLTMDDLMASTSSFSKYPRRNWETDQCW